jgi:hypothetical protein
MYNVPTVYRMDKQESTHQYRNLRVAFDIGVSTLVCLLTFFHCSTSVSTHLMTHCKRLHEGTLLYPTTTFLLSLPWITFVCLLSDSLFFIVQHPYLPNSLHSAKGSMSAFCTTTLLLNASFHSLGSLLFVAFLTRFFSLFNRHLYPTHYTVQKAP